MIAAHAATGRADAAKHGHAPGPTEPPGEEAGRHPPTQPLRDVLPSGRAPAQRRVPSGVMGSAACSDTTGVERVKQGPRTYPAHAGDPLVYNGADRDAKTTIPD